MHDKLKIAVERDAQNSEIVHEFMKIYVAVDKDRAHLVEGSIGHDVLTLFEGLKVPVWAKESIRTSAFSRHRIYLPYLDMLGDYSSTMTVEDATNGFMLTSPADVTRTKAIKRWAAPQAYRVDARTLGFVSAIQSITKFAMAHIETYRVYSGLLDLDVTATPLVERVSNANDWESVWRCYSKLVFGGSNTNSMTERVKSDARKFYLDDKNKFAMHIHSSQMKFAGLAALDTIQLGRRR